MAELKTGVKNAESIILSSPSVFSKGKKEYIMEKDQYPFALKFNANTIYDSFCMVLPASVFSEHAEGWSDFKRTDRDTDSIWHIAALELIAEALNNAREMGTRNDKSSLTCATEFLFRPEAGSPLQPKFRIICELLVKDLYADEKTDTYHDIPALTADKNFVGIRFFFLAHDPKFRFADAIRKQIFRKNRAIRSTELDVSDDESDEEEQFVDLPARKEGEGEEDDDTENDELEEALENLADARAAARKPKKFMKKKQRQTRDKKQRDRMFTRPDPKLKGRLKLSPHEVPDMQFLHVTDFYKLCGILFDLQLGEKLSQKYYAELQTRNFDIDSDLSPVHLGMLDCATMIRRSREMVGCHPDQANPRLYFSNFDLLPNVVDAQNDDDDDDAENELLTEAMQQRLEQLHALEKQKDPNFEPVMPVRELARRNVCSLNSDAAEKFVFDAGTFKVPCPRIGFMLLPRQFTARELMTSYFPWYVYSEDYLEERLLSTILLSYRMNICAPARVDELQKEIRSQHAQKCRGELSKIKNADNRAYSNALGMNVHVKDSSREQAAQATAQSEDPCAVIGQLVDELQKAVYFIYNTGEESNHRLSFIRCMERSAILGLKLMFRVLSSDNERLPDSVVAIMNFMRDNGVQTLCSDLNAITLDLSPVSNDYIRFLLQMETLQISVTHFLIYQTETAFFSAYVPRERCGVDMKPNMMLHGPPGTGKSNVLLKAASNLIDDSYQMISGRSAASFIDTKSHNCSIEIYDEGNQLYDTADSKLSSKDKQMKRIEQSGMSSGKIQYPYTYFDTNNKRAVHHIKMPYDAVKVSATNAPQKSGSDKDAMDDRWLHTEVMGLKRKGKEILDFETALNGTDNAVHELNIQKQRRMVQLRMFLGLMAVRMCGLPPPDLTTLRVRLAQTSAFLEKKAPNSSMRVRQARMLKTTAVVETMRYATTLAFASELSPFRALEGNLNDHKIVFDKFEYQHLRALGPYLACPDDVAIRVITNEVNNLLQPMHYLILYCIAKEYGALDMKEVFKYIDDTSEEGYQRTKEAFRAKEKQVIRESIQSLSGFGNNSENDIASMTMFSGPSQQQEAEKESLASLIPSSTAEQQEKQVSMVEARYQLFGYTKSLQVHGRARMSKRKMEQEGMQTETNVYVAGTTLADMQHQSTATRVPKFASLDDAFTNTKSFCASYLQLSCSEQELRTQGHDLCRKYNLHYDTYCNVVNGLFKRSVKMRHTSNIPEQLKHDAKFIAFKLAEIDASAGTKTQSGEAIWAGHDKHVYMTVDLLFEAPDRIVELLAKEFCEETTHPRTILLGTTDEKNPFCPKSVRLESIKGKKIRIPNPKYCNAKVYNAIYTQILDEGKGMQDRLSSAEFIDIDNLEEYALQTHFAYSGFPKQLIKNYLPKNLQLIMDAYYQHFVRSDETLASSVPRMTKEDEDKYMMLGALKYAQERSYAFDNTFFPSKENGGKNTAQFFKLRELAMDRRAARKYGLMNYPDDFMLKSKKIDKLVEEKPKPMESEEIEEQVQQFVSAAAKTSNAEFTGDALSIGGEVSLSGSIDDPASMSMSEIMPPPMPLSEKELAERRVGKKQRI